MEFNAFQMDALQELANIGSAHSATTLSQMLNTNISMSVPKIDIIDISKAGAFLTDEMTTMVVFELQGDIPHGGFLILHFPRDSAKRTANIMQGFEYQSKTVPWPVKIDDPFSEMDQSAILEVGNIMVSSFLSASSDLIGLVMLPSPPILIVDMAHAAITSLVAQMTVEVDDVILFKVRLTSDEHKIAGNILIFLEVNTLEQIAKKLEAMIKSGNPT
ncbi:MAG: chemotaxis protein CheC [Methanoregula sp.]|nr:chemotaxis protein CheC [Methanoregula sp.]